MADPQARFFGYGSLVNRATHDYPGALAARLTGWRRVWVHVAARPLAYLSAEPAEGAAILGLVAQVPGADWAALDLREAAYDRHPVLAEAGARTLPVQVFSVAPESRMPRPAGGALLLSYIDVVVQGFLREFGPEGAAHFFETTAGWGADVLDDRQAPLYPRAQHLTLQERQAVDQGLERLGARRITPSR